MDLDAIIAELDAEIAELEAAITQLKRALGIRDEPVKRGRDRPKAVISNSYSKRSILNPEARARVAAAQKRRRAAAKKAKYC